MNKILYTIYSVCRFLSHVIKFLSKQVYSLFIRGGFASMEGYLEYPCHVEGEKYISVGKGTVILKDTILTAWDSDGSNNFKPSIIIGDRCNIGEHSHITACGKISIGNNVLTGRYVLISDNSHGHSSKDEASLHPLNRPLVNKGEIIIGDNVWLGERVCVLGGVVIGTGSIIAANSVVTKSIPDFCVAAGVPARVIKYLSNEV